MINKLMNLLYWWCKPLIEARWFEILISLIIFANSIALIPQVVMVFTAPSVEGIAVPMWFIFLAIQSAFTFYGIKVKDASIFFSMFASFLETATIITTVYVRS